MKKECKRLHLLKCGKKTHKTRCFNLFLWFFSIFPFRGFCPFFMLKEMNQDEFGCNFRNTLEGVFLNYRFPI